MPSQWRRSVTHGVKQPYGADLKHTAMAGDAYVAAMNARAPDREARSAFQRLVLQLAPAGCRILDFGAGPGVDARVFVQHGFKVFAYDHDPRMREAFARYCRTEIARGQVFLREGNYRDFLSLRSWDPAVDVVTANFAPLNLIDDLPELFARLHALTAPNALVIASVLNTSFLGDARYPWWWTNRGSVCLRGEFATDGPAGRVHRRTPRNFARAAAPYFSFQRAVRGLPGPQRLITPWLHSLWLTTSQYMFLVFARR
jgi:SAM-dependent methyltransferase